MSMDGGHTWEPRSKGISVNHVYHVSARETNGKIQLFVGTEPGHLFRSTDYGESWEEVPSLRSVPGIEKWTFPAPPHQGHVKCVTFHPRDPRTFFVSVEQGGLYKTTDDGQTWQEFDSFVEPDDEVYKDVHRTVLHPDNPDVMYITSGEGFYCSRDAGKTWEHVTTRRSRIGYPDQLIFSPIDSNVMFISGSEQSPGVWRTTHWANAAVGRSRDAGRTWEIVNNGLPDNMRANIEAMTLHAQPDGYSLFIATTDGDIFESNDEADSWTQIASGLAPISKVGHYRALAAAAS
jgi:photosystem II stability/assembly factor-like uncharacterized protein